jgi:hypothetical protein
MAQKDDGGADSLRLQEPQETAMRIDMRLRVANKEAAEARPVERARPAPRVSTSGAKRRSNRPVEPVELHTQRTMFGARDARVRRPSKGKFMGAYALLTDRLPPNTLWNRTKRNGVCKKSRIASNAVQPLKLGLEYHRELGDCERLPPAKSPRALPPVERVCNPLPEKQPQVTLCFALAKGSMFEIDGFTQTAISSKQKVSTGHGIARGGVGWASPIKRKGNPQHFPVELTVQTLVRSPNVSPVPSGSGRSSRARSSRSSRMGGPALVSTLVNLNPPGWDEKEGEANQSNMATRHSTFSAQS